MPRAFFASRSDVVALAALSSLAIACILSAGAAVAVDPMLASKRFRIINPSDVHDAYTRPDRSPPLSFEDSGLAGAMFSPGQQIKVTIRYPKIASRPKFPVDALVLVRGGTSAKMFESLKPDDMKWDVGRVTMWVTLPSGDDIVEGDDYELWAQQEDPDADFPGDDRFIMTHSPHFSIRKPRMHRAGQHIKVTMRFPIGSRPEFPVDALALVRGGTSAKMYKPLKPDDMKWGSGRVTMWVTLPSGDDIVDGDDYELWAQEKDPDADLPSHFLMTRSPRFSIRN